MFVLFRQVRHSHHSWPGAGAGSLYISGIGHDVRRNKTMLNTNKTTQNISFVYLIYIYEYKYMKRNKLICCLQVNSKSIAARSSESDYATQATHPTQHTSYKGVIHPLRAIMTRLFVKVVCSLFVQKKKRRFTRTVVLSMSYHLSG